MVKKCNLGLWELNPRPCENATMTPWFGKKGVVKGLALNLANTEAPLDIQMLSQALSLNQPYVVNTPFIQNINRQTI